MTDVSKLTSYLVTGPEDDLAVTKLTAYRITGPPVVPGVLHIQTWTFTLDDHDFFVVQLMDETLVHDFNLGKWYSWGSGVASDRWRAALGQTWNANLGVIMKALGGSTQSSTVCGDDVNGALYFLDPTLAEDDSQLGVAGQPFSRIITGEIAMRGSNFVSCPMVEITSSNGEASSGLVNANVELTISDDRGHNYRSAGALAVDPGVYNITLAWRSLGSFTGPGRLFRITDYGALARVDGMDLIDGK